MGLCNKAAQGGLDTILGVLDMDGLEEMSARMARLENLSPRERYGERLARARKGLKLSQQEVAERLSVERKAVSRAEGGGSTPEELLVALEGLYGFKVSYPSAPRDPERRTAYFDGVHQRRIEAEAV